MRKKTTADVLRAVPLFEELSARDRRAIEAYMKEEWFNAGEDVVLSGEPGGRFYAITKGRARVIMKGKTLRTVGPGGYFGEMSLIDGSERSATVRAETQLQTVSISRNAFLGLLEENWSMTKRVLADLSGRIRAADRSGSA